MLCFGQPKAGQRGSITTGEFHCQHQQTSRSITRAPLSGTASWLHLRHFPSECTSANSVCADVQMLTGMKHELPPCP